MARVLILGTNTLARELVREILARPHCGHAVIGMVSENYSIQTPSMGWPVLGAFTDLHRLIRVYEPDEIIVALPEHHGCYPLDHLVDAQVRWGIKVESAVEFYERLTGKLALEALTAGSVLFTHEFRPRRPNLWLARFVSLVCALTGLVVFLPLMALIALVIKLDSPGPALFVQERCGLNCKSFRLLKFRSMRTDMPAVSEWECDNGARITRTGHWLRKFRLDELPQFINVLRGEMNIVGPRPHPTTNRDLIVLVARNMPQRGEPIPYYSLRLGVRPGITGWAQVRYKYANELNEEIEKLRYDLYYVKHYSLWLDLRILLGTIRVMLFGHRVAGEAHARRTAASSKASRPATLAAARSSGKQSAGASRWTRVDGPGRGYPARDLNDSETADQSARRI
ncbi:MAG: sugar transferase [Gammaproteobacteria bacterium]